MNNDNDTKCSQMEVCFFLGVLFLCTLLEFQELFVGLVNYLESLVFVKDLACKPNWVLFFAIKSFVHFKPLHDLIDALFRYICDWVDLGMRE